MRLISSAVWSCRMVDTCWKWLSEVVLMSIYIYIPLSKNKKVNTIFQLKMVSFPAVKIAVSSHAACAQPL